MNFFFDSVFKYYDLPTRFLNKSVRDFYARRVVKLYAAALSAGDRRSPQELENLSFKRAFKLIKYAKEYVPRWYDLDINFDWGENKTALKKFWLSLPVTSKLDYKSAPQEYTLSRHPYFRIRRKSYYTSGTTGSPLNFYYEHYRYEIHHAAALYYALGKIGAPFVGRYILTTFYTVFLGNFFPVPVVYYPIELDLLYPDEVVNYGRRDFGNFFNKLSVIAFERRPVLIMRPSQALIFARWLIEASKELTLPFVVLVGENLSEDQRHYIEGIFRCPARMIYSTKELSIMGYECLSNLGHIHTFPETHLIEILNPSKQIFGSAPNDSLAITSFVNLTMPFIRYNVGDLAVIGSIGSCSCGSSRPLLKILGRDNHFIKLKNKTVSFITLDYFVCHNRFHKIKQLQFIQNSLSSFLLKIAATSLFTKKDELDILVILKGTLSKEIDIKIEYVDFIPPEPSGKFVNFKSLI